MIEFVTRAATGLRSPARPVGTVNRRLPKVIIHTVAVKFTSTDRAAAMAHWQSIQTFHINTRGWSDIGYQWGVTPTGLALEGRGWGRSGAHTTDHNRSSVGIVFFGNGDTQPATEAQWQAARAIIAVGITKGWIHPDYEVYGHREWAPKSCPGELIFPHLDARLEGVTIGDAAVTVPAPEPDPPPTLPNDVPPSDLPAGPFTFTQPAGAQPDVKLIQAFLANRAAKQNNPAFDPGPVDGIYGSRTEGGAEAWADHLRVHGWRIDTPPGVWDASLRSATVSAFRGDTPDDTGPTPPDPVPARPIIAETAATENQAAVWAQTKQAHPRFTTDIIPALFAVSNPAGVDLTVAVAQAALETGWGRFEGIIGPEWRNTAGIKKDGAVGDTPEDHHRFGSWAEGAQAQIDHLALYAGHVQDPTPDPRHFVWLAGQAPLVADLGGRWAPNPEYGTIISGLADDLDAHQPPEPDPDPEPEPDPGGGFDRSAIVEAVEAIAAWADHLQGLLDEK